MGFKDVAIRTILPAVTVVTSILQRFREPVPAEDPIVRQTRVRAVSSTREWPKKWTLAHARKAAWANQLPASLSAKRTAAFGPAFRALGASPFGANL
jgi:hypothetical protein